MINNSIELKDNRYVISSRKEQIEKLLQAAENNKPKGVVNGLRHLTPTPIYRRLKLLNELKLLGYEFPAAPPLMTEESPTENKILKKKKKKDKKKHGKKKHKNKKEAKKVYEHISYNLTERNERNSNLMAELLKKADKLSIVDNCLWVYNHTTGCYDSCDVNNVSAKLRMLLDEKDRLKVSSQEYKEAYNQLMISEELISEKSFFANGPYVNCMNGVVDVRNGELLPHCDSYRFKHYIRANYDPAARCKKFLKFVDVITSDDEELKYLLQVIFGVILSHYNNFKTAILLYGPSNVGKSVLCKILAEIIGTEYVTYSDLADLHKQEFAATLSGKLLNIAPDLRNGDLKDVGAFKALTSHNDTIAARALYANPCNVKGETKMVFCSNHLLSFDSKLDIEDIEAVYNRLLYFPFTNKPFTENDNNKHFSDEVLEERDGIFTWAMHGLRMYIENGETFPYAKHSQKLKQKNMVHFCPEKTFADKCIVIDAACCESTEVVKRAYDAFCNENNVTVAGNIQAYIKGHKKIKVKKKRIDDYGNLLSSGNLRAAYLGLRLKDKYRR